MTVVDGERAELCLLRNGLARGTSLNKARPDWPGIRLASSTRLVIYSSSPRIVSLCPEKIIKKTMGEREKEGKQAELCSDRAGVGYDPSEETAIDGLSLVFACALI